jgi:hypothetical protein
MPEPTKHRHEWVYRQVTTRWVGRDAFLVRACPREPAARRKPSVRNSRRCMGVRLAGRCPL